MVKARMVSRRDGCWDSGLDCSLIAERSDETEPTCDLRSEYCQSHLNNFNSLYINDSHRIFSSSEVGWIREALSFIIIIIIALIINI